MGLCGKLLATGTFKSLVLCVHHQFVFDQLIVCCKQCLTDIAGVRLANMPILIKINKIEMSEEIIKIKLHSHD